MEAIVEAPANVDTLKRLVERSGEVGAEFEIKIYKKEGSEPLQIKSNEGRSTHTTGLQATMRVPKSEICLTSHTHYVPNIPGYDPNLSIFLSDEDINDLTLTGWNDKNEHLGSFFIPSPTGITFIANSGLADQNSGTNNYFHITTEGERALGHVSSAENVDVDINEINCFRVENGIYKINLDVVFIPYEQIESTLTSVGITFDQLLVEHGMNRFLTELGVDKILKLEGLDSMLQVIRKTKSVVKERMDNL